MEFTILRVMRYRKTYIYVTQFGHIFQYLVSWQGKVFQDHVTMKPSRMTRLLNWMSLKPLYNQEQLEQGEEIVLSGAMATIDKLIEKAPDERKRRRQEERREAELAKKDCTWQALFGKGEKRFMVCLTHQEAVELKDGVKPKHE